jgi:predicted MPP superfamily phosphohydrolase
MLQRKRMLFIRRLFFALVALGLAVGAFGYFTATSDPVVRHARLALPGWPEGEPPVRVVLLSDIHIDGPDTPPSRVARVVERVNALRPDVVLIAGDFVSDKRLSTGSYTPAVGLAPLRGLRARLGTFAVLGNHDEPVAAAVASALRAAGVRLLHNEAVRAGPLAIGGIADLWSRRADIPLTAARMRALGGAQLLLSHNPDVFPDLPPDVALTLSGHTHCGQVSLPLIGTPVTFSDYGERYACGLVEERGRRLVVTAGIGNSMAPFRIGAPPDLWLLDLRPAEARSQRR